MGAITILIGEEMMRANLFLPTREELGFTLVAKDITKLDELFFI